jgi:ABC-type dipeptide/oligopeptide/nickel transport system permease subunit
MTGPENIRLSGGFMVLLRALGHAIRHHRLSTIGFFIILFLVATAAFAPLLAPYEPYEQDLYNVLSGPSAAHWLGTDNVGRDLLSRFLYGGRVSLLLGLVSTLLAAAIGVSLGLLAGFKGGLIDAAIMRVVDAILCFPFLVFLLAMAAALGGGLINLGVALVLFGWVFFARIVRGQVLLVRELPYVEAARAAGASSARLMWRHILPNTLAPVIVAITLGIGNAILAESAISFLGLGVQPPTASWGKELKSGFDNLELAPLYSIVPGILITLSVLACNFLGDGLRDALDPRLRGEERR